MHWSRRHPRGRPPHPDVLTPAEWRVLHELRAERSNAEIAVRLGVSINTVRTHVSSMLAKLDLPDRQALAAWDGEPAAATLAVEERGGFVLPLSGWLTGKGWAPVAAAGSVVAIAATLLVVLPLALDGSDEPATQTAVELDEESVFLDLLAFVPDTPQTRSRIHMTDLAAVRDFLDEHAPDGDLDDPRFPDYLDRWFTLVVEQQMGHLPSVIPLFQGSTGRIRDYTIDMLNTLRDSIGLDLLTAEGWVASDGGTLGDDRTELELHALLGPFEAESLRVSLAGCDECPPSEVIDYRGWTIHAWGEDFEEGYGPRLAPPYFDNLGSGWRLVFADGSVLRAYHTAGVEAMIDSAEGDASLADDEDSRLAAAGMAQLGAMNAYITDAPSAGSPFEFYEDADAAMDDINPGDEQGRRRVDAWIPRDGDVLLRPFSVIAAGFGSDGEPYSAVVLVHDSVEAAEENARRLPGRIDTARLARLQPRRTVEATTWGELFDDVEVVVAGRVVLATLRGPTGLTGGGLDLIWESLIAVEPLFQVE